MLQQLAEENDALIRKGIQTKDIAILVRKNKTIPAIADYFDKHTPYRIVSDEAFRLDAFTGHLHDHRRAAFSGHAR